MKFEDSKYYNPKHCKKIVLSTGTMYYFNNIVVGEINNGVHIDWETISEDLEIMVDCFEITNKKVSYISNRLNSYSIEPSIWAYLHNHLKIVIRTALIYYTNNTEMATKTEQLFSDKITSFSSLDEGIEWLLTYSNTNS